MSIPRDPLNSTPQESLTPHADVVEVRVASPSAMQAPNTLRSASASEASSELLARHASTAWLHAAPELADVAPLPDVTFSFKVADNGPAWRVLQLRASEGLSELYECVIDLATDDLLGGPDDMLEKACVLSLSRNGHTRRICGLIRQVDDQGSTDLSRLARVHVVPWLWQLSQRVSSRIFQHMSARDVVKAVLRDASVYTSSLRDETTGQYPEREFCVQYRESDLAFVMRLLEDEGIGFYFAHGGETEALVLVDEVRSFPPAVTMDGGEVPIVGTGTAMVSTESVRRFDWGQLMAPTGVTLRDYDFTHPSAWVNVTRSNPSAPGPREVYDYPARYTHNGYSGCVYNKHDGVRLAQVRNQEHRTWERIGRGRGNVTAFTPGFTFALADHGRGELNRRYVIAHVDHFGVAPEALRETHVDEIREGDRYHNTFTVIDAAGPYRPRRVTPRPIVHGSQTARVVGPPGEEIHVDEHGRIKVQFHWDRLGDYNDKSSCWIRVSQAWGGGQWGFVFVPRIGMEVIATFLDGDPDRPMITGCVYNAESTTPYPLPEAKTKSVLRTNSTPGGGGYNELRFEDQANGEEVYLRAQKDFNELVKNNHSTTVNANQTNTVHGQQIETVDLDQSLTVTGNRTKTVHSNELVTVDQDRTEVVHGHESITVDQTRVLTVTHKDTETYRGDRETTVRALDKLTVYGHSETTVHAGNKITTVHGEYNTTADTRFHVTQGDDHLFIQNSVDLKSVGDLKIYNGKTSIEMTAAGVITLTASQAIRFVCGGSSVSLESNGTVSIRGTTQVTVGSGPSAVQVAPGGVCVSGPKINATAVGVHEISGALVKIN